MAQNLTNFDAVLKEVYLGPIREQLNNEILLLQQLQKNTDDVSGRHAVIPLHMSRNLGIGARADAGTLPTAGQQGYTNSKWLTKYTYGRFKVTGPTIKASKNDKGAFAKAIDANMKGLTMDLKKDIQRQLYGDSSGGVAVIDSDTVTTPLTVIGLYWDANKYLPDNQPIQSMVVADYTTLRPLDSGTQALVNGTATATSVPFDTGVFTSAVTGDLLGHHGSMYDFASNDGKGSREMNGLRLVVDDGNNPGDSDWWNADGSSTNDDTLGQVDINSYPEWKAVVKESNSPRTSGHTAPTRRALTEDLMDQVVDEVADNGGKVDLIVTTRAIRRQYINLLRADKRFVNTTKLDGGWTAIDFNGIPIVAEADCTRDDMYFLTKSSLTILEESDFNWMDEDGAILSRVSGEDAYEAVLFLYAQMATYARNQNGRLTDIEAGQVS